MITVETVMEDDVVVVKLAGRLDVQAAREVDSTFVDVAATGKDVVLDFAELDYIASAGLRSLKRLRGGVRENGKTLVVRNVQDHVMEVFEITGFAALLVFE